MTSYKARAVNDMGHLLIIGKTADLSDKFNAMLIRSNIYKLVNEDIVSYTNLHNGIATMHYKIKNGVPLQKTYNIGNALILVDLSQL